MTVSTDKDIEQWRLIGNNVPKLEIYGPYSNQYKIFIEDIDEDIICLLPTEAKRLIKRLEDALMTIAERRKLTTGKQKKVINL